jgi:hypothetical protein
MRLKSWESPRNPEQRNTKSKQASARLRQLKKRDKQLRKKLKKTPGSESGVFFWRVVLAGHPQYLISNHITHRHHG